MALGRQSRLENVLFQLSEVFPKFEVEFWTSEICAKIGCEMPRITNLRDIQTRKLRILQKVE